MEFKNEAELIDWIYTMHLQNLSGREDFTEAFKQGITATIKELRELKLFDLHSVNVPLPKWNPKMDNHPDNCQCKPCLLLKSIFGNAG